MKELGFMLLIVIGMFFMIFLYNKVTTLKVESLSTNEIQMGMTTEEISSLFKKYKLSFTCNQNYSNDIPEHYFGKNITYKYCKGTYKTGRGVYSQIHKKYYVFGNNKLKMMVSIN